MKDSKLLVIIILVLVFIGTSFSFKSNQVKLKAVEVPRDIILPVSAYQPDCPLKLTYVSLRQYLEGGTSQLARYKNESRKIIKGYTIAIGSSLISVNTTYSKEWIAPGKELLLGTGEHDQIVQLSQDLKNKFDLQSPMKNIIIFMVVRVVFTDGTIYDDHKTYNELLRLKGYGVSTR